MSISKFQFCIIRKEASSDSAGTYLRVPLWIWNWSELILPADSASLFLSAGGLSWDTCQRTWVTSHKFRPVQYDVGICVSKGTVAVVLFSWWNLSSQGLSLTFVQNLPMCFWICTSSEEMRGGKKKHGDFSRNESVSLTCYWCLSLMNTDLQTVSGRDPNRQFSTQAYMHGMSTPWSPGSPNDWVCWIMGLI